MTVIGEHGWARVESVRRLATSTLVTDMATARGRAIPQANLRKYDDLYVVSDLHLGGRVGCEVFDSSEQLTALIRWLCDRPSQRPVALVLNGDIVDFLAFPGAGYFNPDRAVEWLRSLDNPSAPTAQIFASLRGFTSRANAHLIVLGGNHDIEFSLPDVQQTLLDMVAGNEAARARVTIRVDGTGYACDVGGRSVLCVHGNDRDEWNVVDHEALRQFRRAANLCLERHLEPNAGTRLVIDIMNPIKERLPFVDLLKPEDAMVPDILLSLDAERRGLGIAQIVGPALNLINRKRGDARRIRNNRLGGDAAEHEDVPGPDSRWGDRECEGLFEQVEQDHRAGRTVRDVLRDSDGSLGAWDRISIAFGIGRERSLRRALWDAWTQDEGFDPHTPDATFLALDAWVGKDVDILIAGHTHLEKHITECPNRPEGIYLNTGTWMRLIEIRPEHLEDAYFPQLISALTAKSMAELDDANINGVKLVVRRRTVACVEVVPQTGRAYAGLRHVSETAASAVARGQHPFEEAIESDEWASAGPFLEAGL